MYQIINNSLKSDHGILQASPKSCWSSAIQVLYLLHPETPNRLPIAREREFVSAACKMAAKKYHESMKIVTNFN